MEVHSSFSPAAAILRFSSVLPMPPVTNLYQILACSFSFPDVSSKMLAICTKPSFFALDAKKVYFVRAWDSPAKAAHKFFSVCEPLSSINYHSFP